MTITKSQSYLLLIALTALAVVARTGPVVDALLLLTAGLFSLELVLRPQLPQRVRLVLVAFVILFLIYLSLTFARPSGGGIVNVVGVAISGIFFLFFAQNAQKIIAARGSTLLLSGIALLVLLAGYGLHIANKNTVSGITAYFILAAGVVAIARGAPLLRTSFIVAMALSVMGILVEHRLMTGVSIGFLGVVLMLQLAPLRMIRNLSLLILVGGILLFIALFAGLWGMDIRNFDDLFIEYTGRTARSGRQIIWPIIIAATADSPWFGLGTGATFSNLYNSNWSAHSYFLQIYMQVGIIGLTALLLVLLAVWSAIGPPMRSQPLRIYLTGCLIMLLIHMSFEVFLMQVNLLMGCVVWMMLGLGIGGIRASAQTGPTKPNTQPEPHRAAPPLSDGVIPTQ